MMNTYDQMGQIYVEQVVMLRPSSFSSGLELAIPAEISEAYFTVKLDKLINPV